METKVDNLDEKESLNQLFLKPQTENDKIIQNKSNLNQNIEQFFAEPEIGVPKKIILSSEKCSSKCGLIVSFLILLDPCGFAPIFIFYDSIPLLILSIAFAILIIILNIYICYKCTRGRVEIEKNEIKNIISIKAFNCLGCSYKQLEMKHFHFYIGTIYDDRENSHLFFRLFMIKDLENSPEIDLDSSNIKNVPIKLYEYVDYIWPEKAEDILEEELNALVGVSPDYKCPFNFNIREYMNLEPTEKEKRQKELEKLNPKLFKNSHRNTYSKYMKFCENYFCYYIKAINSDEKGDILRIDFIYSKKFDTLFIGLVNNNEKTYKNTFEFQMNSIDNFILQKIGYEDKGYILKVNLKNNESQTIYSLERATKEELGGLAYLLNEKLKNNNNKQIGDITEENPPPTPNLVS